jgi:hypothetical protein
MDKYNTSRDCNWLMESGSFFNVEHACKSKNLSFDNPPMFPGSVTSAVQSLNINHSNDMQGTYTRQKNLME